ncbi:MAG: MarR family transcriptional regulator [Solirubrobacteraceae bacterium]|jgi:DNA-binding MarR family transcriptional regulator
MTDPASPARTADEPVALAPTLSTTLGYLLHRSFQLVERVFVEELRDIAHPKDLTLVSRLLAAGPQAQHDLALTLGVNRSVMVHRLDALEQAGLATRTRNPADRRSQVIAATPHGAVTLEAAGPRYRAADAKLTSRLDATQRQRLYALLGDLLGPSLPEVLAPVSESVGFRITRAHFALHARADAKLEPLGLEVREYGLLATARDIGPCSQQQIAHLHDVSGPVIVELVDTLEGKGLILRERNPSDRRSYALRLTPAGETTLARAMAGMADLDKDVAAQVGIENRDELYGLLRALLGAPI